jgi:hypothetical protein
MTRRPDTRSGPVTEPGRSHHARSSPSPRGPDAASVADGTDSGRALPHDQPGPARLAPGDATGRLDGHLGVLAVALVQWAARDDTRPEPGARRAANTAMDAIGHMLAGLHQLRARLVSETRQADDLAAERADALLARLREKVP